MTYKSHSPVHIKNAMLWTGLGEKLEGEIVLQEGKISAIGPSIPTPANAIVIDAKGRVVTPGEDLCQSF